MRTVYIRVDRVIIALLFIGILAAIFFTNFGNKTSQGRDIRRKNVNVGRTGDDWLYDTDAVPIDTIQARCPNKTVHLEQNVYILQPRKDVRGMDMGSVRSKDVHMMKKVCDILDECRGFNSNGWLKRAVDQTVEAPSTDLYMKQVLDQPQRSEEVTEKTPPERRLNLTDEHTDMAANLKIFMYKSEKDSKIKQAVHWKYAVESHFIQLLDKSKFVTQNPEEATFFFLPFRCATYRNVIRDRSAAQTFTENLVRDILEEIKSRSLGADHFYICGHDMGASSASSADGNLLKNAIALVNTADYADEFYVPHKDISLPPHFAHGKKSLSEVARGGEGFQARDTLAFYAGNLGSGDLRQMMKQWANDSDIIVHNGHLPQYKYVQYLLRSKFCLILRGFRVWSPVVMESVWAGCVPVIISDYYHLPLHGLVDWNKMAVFVLQKEVSNLKNILVNLSDTQLRKKQEYIKQVYHHFVWNDPPKPFDAFNSIMLQLWRKRNVLRYK